MCKQEYNLIFVVLTYRNTEDLEDFLISIKKTIECKYKVIIVNSYFDEDSYYEFKKIAMNNDCDFINIENKGYGYGNNRGIEFAKENYLFKFLIISNPDIEIVQFPLETLKGLENSILAPTIKTLNGKNQNPYYYSKIELVEWLRYYSCIKNCRVFDYIGIIINKLYREITLRIDRLMKIKKRNIYACHGSFIIIGSKALEKLGKIFDERMFLFAEENHLARLALEKSVNIYMIPEISVIHKEDGSIGLEENKKIAKYMCQSFIIYYENWKKECVNRK